MNKDICFIICTNDEIKLNECIHYISQLDVPEGINLDLITIADATSITSGYNEGMNASDADIKIYIHQDVYILNRYFLHDVISLFDANPKAGMIGMVGYERLSPDGIMWNEPRIGGIYLPDMYKQYGNLSSYRYDINRDGYRNAAVCDGFMLITRVDIEWDTDIVTGWDYYDVTQCMKFLCEGYEIIVPNQNHPWCIHDDGGSLYVPRYNEVRLRFFDKYKHFLGKKYDEIQGSESAGVLPGIPANNEEMEQYFKWVESYNSTMLSDKTALLAGADSVLKNRSSLKKGLDNLSQSWTGVLNFLGSERGKILVSNLADVRRFFVAVLAMDHGDKGSCINFSCGIDNYQDCINRYLTVLFCIRRLYFALSEESVNEAKEVLEGLEISPYVLAFMLVQEWADGDARMTSDIRLCMESVWTDNEMMIFNGNT